MLTLLFRMRYTKKERKMAEKEEPVPMLGPIEHNKSELKMELLGS